MATYSKQPTKLKSVIVDRHMMFFKMDVTKNRMIELINDKNTDVSKDHKGNRKINRIGKVSFDTNSVWYDKNGNCILSNED